MNERLEGKLKRLSREDFVDWAGDRTVQRGEGYLDRAVIAEAYGKANEPPELPPETVHFKVDENPFGRFAPNGGRHAKDFSFRVVTPGKTYHWDFIVSTLIYSLAKGGLDYSEHHSDGSGRGEAPGADLPMFVCSCGVAQCGGFHDQQCVFGGATVVWRIVYCGTIVEFEFDRVHYEYWALLMLWRMRGSARLRNDPWKSVVDKTGFACAVSALMEARPRCRSIWERIRERRTLDETELAELSMLNREGTVPALRRECPYLRGDCPQRGI